MGWLGLLFLLPVALLVVALGQVITSRPQSLSDELANDLAASETGGSHLGLNGVSSAVFNVEPNSDSQLITGINCREYSATRAWANLTFSASATSSIRWVASSSSEGMGKTNKNVVRSKETWPGTL